MSTLFTDDDADDTELDTTPELATVKQVRLLEGYSYRKEAVRLWTKEKAETVLRACQREERIALQRAAAVAREQDGTVSRGQPSVVERMTAAAYLEQAQGEGVDELTQAVMHTVYVLSDDELRSLAKYLVRKYREPLPAREAGK